MTRILLGALALAGIVLVAILFAPIITIGSVAVLAALTSPAHAAEVATVGNTAVIVPVGDIIVGIAQPVLNLLGVALTGIIMGLIAKFAPWLMQWVTKVQIEGTLGRLMEYGLNATRGAAKGKTLSVDVGSEALAKAVQYGADNATPLILKAAGGLEGLAEKLFRKFDLEPEASAGNVLAPVLEKIGTGEIRKGA